MNPILFAKMACKETYEHLAQCREMNEQPDERGLTGLLDYFFKKYRPTNIGMSLTPPNIEPLKGTDIELWVRYTDKCWRQFMVQCKILHLKDSVYKKLNHMLDGGVLQIDQLIEYAERADAYPLYFLYNHFKDPSPYWKCHQPANYPLLGITCADAYHIKSVLGRYGYRKPEMVFDHSLSIPFSCLLEHIDPACCSEENEQGRFENRDVPAHIKRMLHADGVPNLAETRLDVYHTRLVVAIDAREK